MAIGLARILGFHLLENFNDPYSARSVQDFWRRWHISLSTWFRDYLYIPLGGNRKGKGRMYLNQIMVFGLCGLWHGANWTFLIWGLWHGAFLCVEKIPVVNRFLQRIPHIQGNIYTLIVVEFGWVFFRANNLRQALTYCSAMLGFGSASGHYAFNEFLSPIPFIAMLAGMVLCIPWKVRLEKVRAKTDLVGIGAENIILLLLLVVCASAVASGTYNPFIYFRF
jgi:alginate O-acetyltransferase complex protein AlgI